MGFFQPKYQQCTDESLMRMIAKRDEWAFDELYRRYSQRMLRYFYRMLWQDSEKAQDYLQDLFMKVVEKAVDFDPERRFATWLYTLAANMCKNAYRSQQVRSIMVRAEPNLEGPAIGPDDGGVDRELFQAGLEQEIAQLSDSHREVLVLRFQEELPIKEISEIMACSEGTVKSRLFYALKKLNGKLRAFDPNRNN
ncbi:MAG: RNA polymerase sigma factor [Bacteroidota bacterium]